ncbi:MAG TPA: group III truncated hemoglobin [Chitinophagaceae bacterium]
MKRDIENRRDIETLVNHFYDKVKTDSVIGYIFTDIARVNWEKHLPVMYSFWENALFYTGTYEGNLMQLHNHLHKVVNLTTKHFEQWTRLFASSVDELFEGDNANLIKQRAISISTTMQIKILSDYSPLNKIY